MKNKVLVLGATGNIGSAIVKELQKGGADFIAGVPAPELKKVQEMCIEGVECDFSDPDSLDTAMQGITTLFMLLPMIAPMTDWGRNIIDAAQRNNISFVLRSSLIDARPDSEYFLFKLHGQIDQMLRDSGIPHAIVHPNSFMQNFAVYYANSINSTDTFSFTQTDTAVSYIDVRDIAAVDAQILMHPEDHRNAEYTVTGPLAVSNYEIAALLSQVTGRTIRYVPVEPAVFENGLRQRGMSDWSVNAYMSLEQHIRDGKQTVVTGDVRRVTGRDPGTFGHFARDYAATWMKAPVAKK